MKNQSTMQRMLTLSFPLLAASFLSACGGGGSGGGDSSSSQPSSTPAPPSIDNLTVAPDNNLQSIHVLSVDATEVVPNTERAYLSICNGNLQDSDIATMNYESCLLRTPIDDENNQFSLSLPNHIEELIAVIWFYDVDKQPLTVRWEKANALSADWTL